VGSSVLHWVLLTWGGGLGQAPRVSWGQGVTQSRRSVSHAFVSLLKAYRGTEEEKGGIFYSCLKSKRDAGRELGRGKAPAPT